MNDSRVLNDTLQLTEEMATGPAAGVEEVLDRHARFMRALHFSRSTRDPQWLSHSMTLAQLRTLALLAPYPEGLSGRDLASLLGVSPPAITPLIDRLVAQGLAQRDEDRSDRRVTRLSATAAGLDILERLMTGQREYMARVLAELAPSDLQTVDRAFALLIRAVGAACKRAEEPANEPGSPGNERSASAGSAS